MIDSPILPADDRGWLYVADFLFLAGSSLGANEYSEAACSYLRDALRIQRRAVGLMHQDANLWSVFGRSFSGRPGLFGAELGGGILSESWRLAEGSRGRGRAGPF